MDYRIWNPPEDGRTKNDYFRDMLASTRTRGLRPDMVVADSWYASLDNLKSVRSHGWDWVMGLSSNRLVGKPHKQLRERDIPDEGVVTYRKGYGWIRVFRFAAKHGRTDDVGTSRTDLSERISQGVLRKALEHRSPA